MAIYDVFYQRLVKGKWIDKPEFDPEVTGRYLERIWLYRNERAIVKRKDVDEPDIILEGPRN